MERWPYCQYGGVFTVPRQYCGEMATRCQYGGEMALPCQYGGEMTLPCQYGGEVALLCQYGGVFTLPRQYCVLWRCELTLSVRWQDGRTPPVPTCLGEPAIPRRFYGDTAGARKEYYEWKAFPRIQAKMCSIALATALTASFNDVVGCACRVHIVQV